MNTSTAEVRRPDVEARCRRARSFDIRESRSIGGTPAVLSLAHLDAIRGAEIDKIAAFIPAGARVLEIGAGTGQQALELRRRGFAVTAIEGREFELCRPPGLSDRGL